MSKINYLFSRHVISPEDQHNVRNTSVFELQHGSTVLAVEENSSTNSGMEISFMIMNSES